MKISKTAEYGLLAVEYVAKNSKDGLVTTSSVSKEYGIPKIYLSRIMQELVRANIMESKRGPNGGYTLARPAEEITMLEIVETLDGSLDHMMEITQYAKHATFIGNMERIYKDAVAVEKDILQKAKLSQMIK